MTDASTRRLRWGAVLLVAVLLRLLRAVARWHEDAWLYSVYPAETVDLLRTGQWHRIPWTFTGLHPPAWPVLHGLTEILDPRPIWWLLESVVLSTLAVVLVARRSLLAALVLATAPVAVHYSAEVNQYALLTFALAGLWSAAPRSERAIQWEVVAFGALAGWTHILGGVGAVLGVVTLPAPQRRRSLAVLTVLLAPLAVGSWQAASVSSTFQQPAWVPSLVLHDLVGRFGMLGLVLVGLAGLAIRRAPRLAVGVVVGAGVLGVFVGLRVAAPHQFPYLLTVLPPLVLLAACAPRAPAVLLPLALVQAGWQLAYDGQRMVALARDVGGEERGVDRALASLETPWRCGDERVAQHCAGDALVLLRRPGRNDDDKTRTSPVLWRLRPWWRMPRVALETMPLASSDHRFGQPRLVSMPHGDFVVYVHDQVRPSVEQPFTDHGRAFLVVSDEGAGGDLLADATERTGSVPTPVGPDWVLTH